jgi:hypothetical protein
VGAKPLAVRLKALQIDGVDSRVVESYAVPAAILATARQEDFAMAEYLLRSFVATSPTENQDASDEEDLLQAILRSTVAVERGGKTTRDTIAKLLTTGGMDDMEALERVGIGIVYGRRGSRQSNREDEREFLFIDYVNAEANLLKDTPWKDQSIEQILQRVEGSPGVSRRRLGHRRCYGVSIPMEFIRQEFLSGEAF